VHPPWLQCLTVQVRVLGPVSVIRDAATVDIEVPKHRALLAALALHHGSAVTTSELIDAVWGDDPPASATKTLQTYVSALRREFGDEFITTEAGGYSLGPAVDHVDAVEFDEAVSTGGAHLESGNPAAARRAFGAALASWRGHPLDDLAAGPARDGQTVRLHELRLLAVEGLMEAELAVSHHREVVPDLERLVAEHPYREVLWRSLMLALYRSGRAADALGAYQRLRTTLVDDLGIEPSQETQALEFQILDHDPNLDPPSPNPPTNLAVPLDSFVDRTTERGVIVDTLAEHRLVTLLGIGGVGKSRLANEVGRTVLNDAAGDVWWVDLAAVPASRSVIVQVAAAMRLPAAPGDALDAVLLARLRGSPAILVLDNCEHMYESVASFVEWVTAHNPIVRVLATSRVPLGVVGEFHIHLEPLAIDPADGQQVSDASRLFLDRASAQADMSTADLAAIEALTDVVGGLPLGIELTAAQCALRTPDELTRALHDRGAVLALAGDEREPARHASLGHVLDTTFDELDQGLAAIAPRLLVFPGDFDLTAATAVLGTPKIEAERDIARLLDASLLSHVPSDAPQRRFRVLWPVREHLTGRLDDADRRDAEARHARHFQAFARRFAEDANTPGEVTWLDQARFDDHNLRIAVGWFEAHDAEGALAFGPGLGWAWEEHGDQVEGRDTLRRLLAAAPDAPSEFVAWTEESLCWLELLSGEFEPALAHNVDAIARFEQLESPRALSRAVGSRAHALYLGGLDTSATAPLYERSIAVAREAGLEFAVASAEVSFAQALTAAEEHDCVDVEAMLSHAESVLRRHGDHARLAQAALGRAFIAFGRADATAGRDASEEMLRQSRLARGNTWEQVAHVALGVNAHTAGDDDERRHQFHDAVHIAHDTANRAQLGIALHALAATAAHLEPETAARLWGAAGTMSPLWPLHARRYGEWLEAARTALGNRFDELVADGAQLSVDDAVTLAGTIL
jgi:DNA-binding SARP family transcriptional activator/predicted ATPase